MTQGALLMGAIALGIIVITGLATLVVAAFGWREGRRNTRELAQTNLRLESAFEQVQHERWEAQQKVRLLENRLEEQRPEKLLGELEQATKELEQLQRRHLETQHQVGRQEQMLFQQAEQQEQQRQRQEQERQHLMEELERWHERYRESHQEVKRLEQERSEAQQKVEQLTQLRERLLVEMRKIDKE